MSTQENVQIVKDFFAAIGRGDKQGLLALSAEDIEWIIPGEDWPLAGTHRGHAGLEDLLHTASETVETSTEPREFVAQGDRVLVIGFATGRIKATNKTFENRWVFDITVKNGKLTNIREYVDTQALARAAEMDATRSDAWSFPTPSLSSSSAPLATSYSRRFSSYCLAGTMAKFSEANL
jgi:ketosteroid isomerase-like protein